MTKFNQKSWLKPYVNMKDAQRRKAKIDSKKDFLNLMNNAVFGKTMKNLRKHRDIKLVTTEARRNYLVPEPTCHAEKEFIKNDKLISKTQQIFKSERHNFFTEEVNKIALSSNDAKRMQSIDSIEIYACQTSKDIVSKKEQNKCSNIIQQYKSD